MAHIAGYLYAGAAASDSGSGPLFLCEGRATSALEASSRVAALAAGLTQLLGMQVRAGSGRVLRPAGGLPSIALQQHPPPTDSPGLYYALQHL